MGAPSVDEKLCNAYWFAGVTHELELANMALITEDVSFILASVGKLRISDHVHIAKIPVYINTSIIKKGEELLWYVPKVEKKDNDEKPVKGLEVKLLGGGKRQKTEGK